jgi:hypothetical protein
MPRRDPKERKADRDAIAELALGSLADGWVLATNLAELIGVPVQQLHAALGLPVLRGVIDKRIDDVQVSRKHGRLPRVMYRRGLKQPEPLPEWLSPAIVPPSGVLRTVRFGE